MSTYGFEIGAYIKLICKNGLVEAGRLVEKAKTVWVLEHLDKSHTILLNPNDNVVAIKVFKPDKIDKIEEDSESSEDDGVFVDEELTPSQYHREEDLRAMELAELHKLRAHEERKRARELLQNHRPTSLPEVNFGQPNFSKSVSQHPKKKTRRRT